MADKYLIINADDFGMCNAANEAVMDLFKNGCLKSSTIMMPCPTAGDAVRFAVENPQYAIGIHLTLTSEWRSYKWGPLTGADSLKTPEGWMWPESDDLQAHCEYKDVVNEIYAQVKKAKEMGMNPSHLDGHMTALYGLDGKPLMLPKAMKAAGKLGYAFRMFTKPLEKECPPDVNYNVYKAAALLGKVLSKINKVPTPDYLLFPKWNDEMRKDYETYREMFLADCVDIPDGISETFVHPALECDEIKGITSMWRDRWWEYQIMKDPKTEQHLNAHGVKLISYRDMLEMRKK